MKVLKVGNINVLLDDWDWLRLCKYKWRLKDDGKGHLSVARAEQKKGLRRTIYMHREIMSTPEGMEVHHKRAFGDTIDNRKENLVNLTKEEHSSIFEEYFETFAVYEKSLNEGIPF